MFRPPSPVIENQWNIKIARKIKNFIGNVILEPSAANGLLHKSEILVFQIRSISKVRLVTCLGNITNKEMGKIENNLNKILKY